MPELNKLMQEATQADVLLVESVDRLSRLTQHDFNKLKKRIQEKELRFVVATFRLLQGGQFLNVIRGGIFTLPLTSF